jgi:hypothetical protein
MAKLRARCINCDFLYMVEFDLSKRRHNVLDHHLVGDRCPNCGGVGRLWDESNDIPESVVQAVRTTRASRAEWDRLTKILERIHVELPTFPEAADAIEKASPALRAVADEFRRSPVATPAALASLVLAAIAALHEPSSRTTIVHSETIINQTITNCVVCPLPAQPLASTNESLQLPRVGPNKPCPCGSGRKYKRCHGAPR